MPLPDRGTIQRGSSRESERRRESAPLAELRIETGSGDPAMVAIDERPLVLGRSNDVDLQIADQRLSRHHCRVELVGKKLVITDLGSSNGTFARGQRVSKVALDPGEAFFVGKTRIVFNLAGTGVMAAVPPPGGAPIAVAPASGRIPLGSDTPFPGQQNAAALAAPPAPAAAAGDFVPAPPVRPLAPTGRAPPLHGGPTAPSVPAHAGGGRDTQQEQPSPIEGYQIFDMLGEGSMGTVYTARSLETGEVCVLKTIKFDGSSKDAIFFIREAQMGMKLKHPNIVSVIDFGEAGGVLFLAMEYLTGGSLLDRIKRQGPVSNATAYNHLVQLAGALDYAGRKKFVHRDIKPANILLTGEGLPKLADFGLAKMMAAQNQAGLTKVGETRGTPIYMPPELLMNAADADGRADIYSLGATYYHALSGFHPFRANSVVEILRMVVEVEPQPIEERAPQVHPGLAIVIRKMMAKKREQRYQSSQELAEDLARLGPVGD